MILAGKKAQCMEPPLEICCHLIVMALKDSQGSAVQEQQVRENCPFVVCEKQLPQ